MQRNMLRWCGHIQRMESERFVKIVHVSNSVGLNSRGRPLGKRKDRVQEYVCEKGATRGAGLYQAKSACLGGGGFSAVAIILTTFPTGARCQSHR